MDSHVWQESVRNKIDLMPLLFFSPQCIPVVNMIYSLKNKQLSMSDSLWDYNLSVENRKLTTEIYLYDS